MTVKKILLLPLILASAFINSADANYFSNPRLNIHLNPGSARTPTPHDVRTNHLPQPMLDANAKQQAQTKAAAIQPSPKDSAPSKDASAQSTNEKKVAAD